MHNRYMDEGPPSRAASEIHVNEFSEKSAASFRKKVLCISDMDPEAPIVVYIDSYGGDAYALAKMIETMHEVPNKFITVCMGKAISCGAILLSCGDVRYCGGYSSIMIHNVSAASWGDVTSLKAGSDQATECNKKFLGLFANNCGMTYEALQDKIKASTDSREIWLTAESAKEFGLIDEIGIPSITPIMGWECHTIPPKPLVDLKPAKKVKKKPAKKIKASKRRKRS